MTDRAFSDVIDETQIDLTATGSQKLILVVLTLAVAGVAVILAGKFQNLDLEAPLLIDSTLGELGTWMADQSTEEAPESILGQVAKDWAAQGGEDNLSQDTLLATTRNVLIVVSGLAGLIAAISALGVLIGAPWSRTVLLLTLLGMNTLLFLVPTVEGDSTVSAVLVAIVLLLIILLYSPGEVTKFLGFVVVLSALLVAWETAKAFADSIGYRVTVPVSDWNANPYPTLEEALEALQAGDRTAVIADRKDLDGLMAPFPLPEGEEIDPEAFDYPALRYLADIDREERILSLPIRPGFPGRLAIAVSFATAADWDTTSQFVGEAVAMVAGDYADESFFSVPRELVLLDLKITNDLNLPHLQNIAEAFLQPARRNGPVLLLRILAEAGRFTWGEAIFGFIFGATLGFLLGSLFAHSGLMERGLLPYVVASQTVPILAIAPMVVIWLGAGPLAVSIIAAYLTFFPVTINTLRGLKSPPPTAIELMRSYAASRWTIMWKLRFPAALPYIFTALKVSATASVVGAIIGELPSSIRNGLGRAILDFSSDYSLISTPKLWAAIIMAAAIGIVFFVLVSVVERFVLRGYVRGT